MKKKTKTIIVKNKKRPLDLLDGVFRDVKITDQEIKDLKEERITKKLGYKC